MALFDIWGGQPSDQAELALIAGLLGGKGNLGGILGRSLSQSQSAYGQAQAQQSAEALKKQQLALEQQKLQMMSQPKPSEGFTLMPGAARFDPTGKKIAEVTAGVDPASPSSVREWQYFNSLPEPEQKHYLDMKRSNYGLQDVGGVPSLVGKFGSPTVTPLSSLLKEIGAAATKAGAVESAKTGAELTTKDQTQAAIDLPKIEAASQYSTKLLEDLKNHPGLPYSVGALSPIPRVPGTPQGDFVTRLDQLQGQQFLQAFETLKGGGQITEVEGKKATEAIARIQRAQSKKAFIEGVNEYEGIIKGLADRARKRSGTQQQEDPLGLR